MLSITYNYRGGKMAEQELTGGWTRKYRPASFDEYMGDNVKNMVINRFRDRSKIPNTIMLYGTRGTGKTSMARLMAKEILCMSPVDGHSCGHCQMCEEINTYITSAEAGAECFGITEVDAASTNGKDDINDIIEDALIPPLYPLTRKILILDECHMLSKAAQNSLLKVIEEPPSHLIFILCTTDPEQVITTIHSRIQMKIEVRKKSVDELAARLKEIAEMESVPVSLEALKIIAKKGDRVPRECISLLESIANSFGHVFIDDVRAAVGDIQTEIYIKFFKAANSSLEDILNFNKYLKEKDVGAKKFIQGLTRFTLDACYAKYGIDSDDQTVDFAKQAKDLFSIYGSCELDTLLQIVESAYKMVDDDETKSELMITTMAIRISKLKLLAEGLAGEAKKAEKENEASLSEYRKHLEEDEARRAEKIQDFGPTKEALNAVFKNMAEIKDSAGILNQSSLQSSAGEPETSTNKVQSSDSEFVSTELLDKLLE